MIANWFNDAIRENRLYRIEQKCIEAVADPGFS